MWQNFKFPSNCIHIQESGWKHCCLEVLPTSSVVIEKEDDVEHEEQFGDPLVKVKNPFEHFSHFLWSMFRYVPASHSTKTLWYKYLIKNYLHFKKDHTIHLIIMIKNILLKPLCYNLPFVKNDNKVLKAIYNFFSFNVKDFLQSQEIIKNFFSRRITESSFRLIREFIGTQNRKVDK